ncbi:MAG: hypothetical protein II773_05340 [Oscillospiraceae bacterium]|nr:hypothetical protein [Oscillospiraceae bacterium]
MTENIDLPFICGIHGRDCEPDLPAEERARLVLEKAENGSLVLLHDLEGNAPTVKALDTIIPELKNRGFEFLTVRGIFKKLGVTPKKGIVYSNVFQQE